MFCSIGSDNCQCGQNGLFLKVLRNKSSYKGSQNIGQLLVLFEKTSLSM